MICKWLWVSLFCTHLELPNKCTLLFGSASIHLSCTFTFTHNMIDFTEDNFESITSSWISLVDFYAWRCWPCQILWKLIPHLARKYEWRAQVGKVNTEVSLFLTQKMNIIGLPTVIIFKDGLEVERLRWLHPPEKYSEVLDKWLNVLDGTH